MKRLVNRRILLFWNLFLLLLTVSGCERASMLRMPRLDSDRAAVQELLERDFSEETEFSAPISGDYCSVLQEKDLDGDGKNEIMAFLHRESDGVSTMTCAVFAKSQDGYIHVGSVNGIGTRFRFVDYASPAGSNQTLLVVSWELAGDAFGSYAVCSYANGVLTVLKQDTCSALVVSDIDGDGGDELLQIRCRRTSSGTAALFRYLSGGLQSVSSVPVSEHAARIYSVAYGDNGSGEQAVFADIERTDGSYLTDVFVVRGGILYNMFYSVREKCSNATRRLVKVSCSDLDGDGCIEFPVGIKGKSSDNILNASSVTWCGIVNYVTEEKFTGYSCGEWYCIIPELLLHSMSVRHSIDNDGHDVFRFCIYDGEDESNGEILWVIHQFVEPSEEMLSGLQIVAEQGQKVWALEITEAGKVYFQEIGPDGLFFLYS